MPSRQDSLITMDATSLDQHKLYYCTIRRSPGEISYDEIVLIWIFLWGMYGHEDTNTINNSFLFYKSSLNLIVFSLSKG